MKLLNTLKSAQDQSVNFIFEGDFEARYVRREDRYFICYLSSHSGCNKSCRFCHLTQTGQTSFDECSMEGFLEQARTVLDYYATQKPAQKIHFNWMARGEPLANSVVKTQWEELAKRLRDLSESYGLKDISFKLSTIFPKDESIDLTLIKGELPEIYYSIYSTNPDFRKKWIPKSENPVDALSKLKAFQDRGGRVVIHHALIKDQNDSVSDAENIVSLMKKIGLNSKFNLVRYNSFSEATGNETDEVNLQDYFSVFLNNNSVSRIVPRVGFDVKASCGMFIQG